MIDNKDKFNAARIAADRNQNWLNSDDLLLALKSAGMANYYSVKSFRDKFLAYDEWTKLNRNYYYNPRRVADAIKRYKRRKQENGKIR